MDAISEKQRRFCREYLVDLNATKAAIRAGYAENSAAAQGSRMLRNANIRAHIAQLAAEIDSRKVADAVEVMEYLTKVLRGEVTACRGQVRAAELLAKRYGLLAGAANATEHKVAMVRIIDDIGG